MHLHPDPAPAPAHTSLSRRARVKGLWASSAISALLAAALAPLASAQQTPEEPAPAADSRETIIVTGSRIRGVQAVGSNIAQYDREDIAELGASTTGDLLRKLPQIVGLGASETAGGAQNGAANVTRSLSVNLRGIGSNATLLLFNGRRMPPSGTQGQITDASVIPAGGIAGLEVVADGGSAIYGSDAVTGVVNIIPRMRFNGQESSIRYGFADGYEDYTIGHVAGIAWDTGTLTATADFNHHSALKGADRDFYSSNLTSRGGTDLRSLQCAPGTILVGAVPYAIPATGVSPATAGTLVANTRNRCDNLKRADIIPEIDRVSVMLAGEQDLSQSLTVFAEGFYSKREFLQGVDQITSNLVVPSTNPFYVNPTGGTGPVTVQYDFARDGGLPKNPGFAESWQAVAGVRYDLGSDWQLEAYASYGESADNVTRVQNLNTTASGINAFLTSTNPATAFNPFGPGGGNNPATVAAVRNGQFIIDGATTLTDVSAKFDGPLFQLPAGHVRMAVGAERREEELTGTLQSGSTTAPVIVPSVTSRDVTALFAEVFVPIAAEGDPVGRLDLSIAGRYEEYSDFGDTFNPKVGLVWAPIGDLQVRGSWGTSFRAPGLAENDPKSSGYGLYGDTLPCTHLPPATTCFGIGIAGGNPGLQPEEATTWSLGADFSPGALSGLRLSATYFDIDYTNQIVGLRGTAGLLTNAFYAPYRTLNPTAGEVASLLASGLPINSPINASLVTYIQDGRRQNIGALIARGVDFDVSHVWKTGVGDVSVGILGSLISDLQTQQAAGAAFLDVLDAINFPQSLRGRAHAGWAQGPWNVRGSINHVGEYTQTGVTPLRSIDAFNTVDLHVSYDLDAEGASPLGGLRVTLDVSNALDEDPPFVNLSGGYDPQSASPIGRIIALGLRKAW